METQFPEAFKLPVKEKIELIGDLWDSICSSSESIPLTDDLIEELDRRKAAHKKDPSAAMPWEEAKKRIRGRS